MSYTILARAEHRVFCELRKKKLKNKDISIIANNCNGGIIAHDLGLQFNSPFVNIGIWPDDYLKFLKNMDYYLSLDPVKTEETYNDGWFAKIDDIKVLFIHCASYEEGYNNWQRRKQRINKDNMFVLFCDKLGCTYENIKEFDELHFEHKVVFTHKPYPEIKSACYIKGFENDREVGILSDWKPGFWKRRGLDQFDSVAFLNGETY